MVTNAQQLNSPIFKDPLPERVVYTAIPRGQWTGYPSYPTRTLLGQIFQGLATGSIIYATQWQYSKTMTQTGYIDPNNNLNKHILKPSLVGDYLQYPKYTVPNTRPGSMAWNGGFASNNPLSNSVDTAYGSYSDFKTFGCYIHHYSSPGLPPALHANTPESLYTFFKNRPIIQGGSLNLYPRLEKNDFKFNFYVRDRYLP